MMEKLGGQRRELGIVGLSHVSVIQQTSMLLDLMSAHKAGKASGLAIDLAFNTEQHGIKRG
jgi:hypothetical protein